MGLPPLSRMAGKSYSFDTRLQPMRNGYKLDDITVKCRQHMGCRVLFAYLISANTCHRCPQLISTMDTCHLFSDFSES